MPGPAGDALGYALVTTLVLAVVFASDLWVYADAKGRAERGNPVVFSASSFRVSTPEVWFFGCPLFWIPFFPLYVRSRARAD